MAESDIVERLRAWPEGSDAPEIACSHRLCDANMTEAATEIERLRVACEGALVAAGRATDECVKLRERCERLTRGQVTLRQRLDATRARLAAVATIAENGIALAAEINRDLLARAVELADVRAERDDVAASLKTEKELAGYCDE